MKRMIRQGARKHAIVGGLLVICLCGLGGGVASQPGPSPRILARVGDLEVSAEAFRTSYIDYLLRTGLRDQPSLRRSFLENMVATRLLVQETRAEGFEDEPAYQFREEQLRRKLLVEVYAHRLLFDTLSVDDDEVRAMFVRAYTQQKVRHLYARTREQADVLYARLQAGETFEALAREVFADPRLAETGGSLGYVGFDEMDAAFEDAAYALEVGEISEPVRTAYGYSIIQVEDRFTNPMLTELDYAQKRANMRAFVLRRKRLQARSEHVRRLTEALNMTFEETAVQGVLGQISGAGGVDGDEGHRHLLSETLVTFGAPSERQAWTVDDFRERARFTSEEQRTQVRTRQDLVDFIQGLVVRDVMMARAQARGLDATPAFRQAVQEATDEVVLERFRDNLAAEVTVPEDSIRRYFDTAPSTEFVNPARVRVGEIMAATKAEAEQVQQQLAHAPFEALARTHSLRPGARTSGGDLGFLTASQLGPLAEAVFEAAEGDVLGPLEVKGHYMLLHVGARQPERPMTYAEARPHIADILRYHYTEARKKAAYAAVRARYDIDVDTQLLYSMLLSDENDT